MKNFSYENEFDLHENELLAETHFHKNGFALGLVLTQRQTRTRKWAIAFFAFHTLGVEDSIMSKNRVRAKPSRISF